MPYVFPPPPVTALPVVGLDALFPVRRVYCVGRNYADHAREMGSDPHHEPPFFFSKPTDAVVPEGGEIPIPSLTRNYHYEAEMVVAIGKGGSDIPVAEALEHVFGYAVGLDMTRRDFQLAMKEQGKPWDTGKGPDFSAPVSAVNPVSRIGHPHSGLIRLTLNGELKQKSDLSNMSLSVAEVIANLSLFFALAPGDLIFTGTPAGVGKVERGDEVFAEVAGVGELRVKFV